MAYCDSDDISSEFKNVTFSTTSAVTTAEVTEFIDQEEAVINAQISNRYEVPVTDSESIKVLKKISIAFVAYRIAKILNLKKDVPIPEKFVVQDLSEGASYYQAKQLLKQIRTGAVILEDATALSSGNGVSSYNQANTILPIWKRDTKQW